MTARETAERDALKADLARVTGERDEHAANCHDTVIRARKAEARVAGLEAAGADTDVCVGYGDAEMAARLHARADALRNAERAIRALAAKGGAK